MLAGSDTIGAQLAVCKVGQVAVPVQVAVRCRRLSIREQQTGRAVKVHGSTVAARKHVTCLKCSWWTQPTHIPNPSKIHRPPFQPAKKWRHLQFQIPRN